MIVQGISYEEWQASLVRADEAEAHVAELEAELARIESAAYGLWTQDRCQQLEKRAETAEAQLAAQRSLVEQYQLLCCSDIEDQLKAQAEVVEALKRMRQRAIQQWVVGTDEMAALDAAVRKLDGGE